MSEQKQKILLIDDDAHICLLVQKYLENAGYQCICASNGFEGLNKLVKQKNDFS